MAWAFTQYVPPMDDLLKRFKFHNKTSLRKTFLAVARTFLERYDIRLDEFQALVPVPMTPVRLRERGYDQALILAQGLSELLKIPCDTTLITRRKQARPQSSLPAKERWTNIHGAFRMKRFLKNNKNILIVDDLLTTGATTSEMARALKEGGAGKVGLLALAVT
ncbi:MAG: ComF family protein [Elusimicrobia bacterium]|nr:ComF family protein [Elusimicrobiota bacterium]